MKPNNFIFEKLNFAPPFSREGLGVGFYDR